MYFKTHCRKPYTQPQRSITQHVQWKNLVHKTLTNDYPLITGELQNMAFNTDTTSLSEESGYWIPASNFTFGYDGEIQFTSGKTKIRNKPHSAFIYSGSNLCND